MKRLNRKIIASASLIGMLCANTAMAANSPWYRINSIQTGSDINATDNPFVQPQDPALAAAVVMLWGRCCHAPLT